MFITVPKGKELFRGRKQLSGITGNWYTFDIDSAKGYGNDIGKYKTKEDLKVINLLSSVFHKDFMDKLTLEFPGPFNNGDDIQKMKLLMPIGLPDLCLQNVIANDINSNVFPIPTDERFLSMWKTLNNVSRFSDYKLDENFAKKIKQLYGSECDGFVLPLRCPSIPLGGEFHQELYVNLESNIEYISDVHQGMVGGSSKQLLTNRPPLHHRFKSEEEYKEFEKRIEEIWNEGRPKFGSESTVPPYDVANIKKRFRKTRKIRKF